MTGPQVPETAFTERAGVNHVAVMANAARTLWRETLMHDVGIDGHLEHVSPEGVATGRMVAVQIKSGQSFFPKGSELKSPTFMPTRKHQEYWINYPHSVVLILYSPSHDTAFWCDARRVLRTNQEDGVTLKVDRRLDRAAFADILALSGPLPLEPSTPKKIARAMLADSARSPSGVYFLDIFLNGLTDTARCLYFGMDIYLELVDFRLGAIILDYRDHEFISSYVGFLVAHNLVRLDFDWFDEGVRERDETSTFLAPLTQRGLELTSYLITRDVEQGGSFDQRRPNEIAVCERFIGAKVDVPETTLRWRERLKTSLDV